MSFKEYLSSSRVSVLALTALLATGAGCTSSQEQATTTSTTGSETSTTTTSSYKDGTYTAVGSYTTPAGIDSLPVTLTIKDGVITEASSTSPASNVTSQKFQQDFSKNIKQLVVGKKLSEVRLDKVSGGSLTPKGFNDAVATIKKEAAM